MKGTAKSNQFTRTPNALTRKYMSATVKNNRNGRVVKKLTKANTITDYESQKFSGSGVRTKKVFKNGVLVREKTRKLSNRRLVNLP